MNLHIVMKRMIQAAKAVAVATIIALFAWTVPTAQATDTSHKVDPKIIQVVPYNPLLALDDQGNVWCMALHAISVKDGFNPTLMVKATGLDNVVSITEGLVLKEDGTVWTVEQNSSDDINNHVSASLGDPIPHLEHIVKIKLWNMLGLALDKDGKLWIFETAPRWVRNDPTFSLKSEPVLFDGLDHIKDMSISFDSASFLKADGSVWNIDYYTPISHIHSHNPSIYDSIRSTKPVQRKELTDIIKLEDHAALKKDGTVWVWGRGMFAKPNDDGTENEVAPIQVAGLSDIIDFSLEGEHAIFVKKDGTVWEWGYFVENWDKIGSETKVWRGISRLDELTDVASVSISSASTYMQSEAAIKKDGTLWIWGPDHFSTFVPKPLQVDFMLNSK